VFKLPRSTLPSRFGKLLLERIDQLTGARAEPVPLLSPPDPIEAVWEFDDPVDDRRTLEEVLRRLLAEIARELTTRRQATMKVRCVFESPESRVQSPETRATETAAVDLQRSTLNAQREPGVECPVSSETRVQSPESRAKRTAADLQRSTLNARRDKSPERLRSSINHKLSTIHSLSTLNSQLSTLNLSRPTASAGHLQELASLKLERATLPAGVTRVRVEAEPLPLPAARQRSLFDEESGVRAEIQLAALLDRLRSRLGDRTVLRPALVDDWLPERSVRWEGSHESRDKRQGQRGLPTDSINAQRSTLNALSQLSTLSSQPSTPLRLYRVPPPVEVALLHHRPLRLRWERREEVVVHSAGPHRLETGWWRKQFIQRDYYRVVTRSGRRLWIFERPRKGGWRVAGE
jgi:hypothetical protein